MAALKNGEVQVVELFSSDGNVVSNNFVALTDNKHLEGADYIVPVIRKSVDTAGVAKVLNAIDAKLTTTAISKLNLDVTSKQEQPAAVAQAWVHSVTAERRRQPTAHRRARPQESAGLPGVGARAGAGTVMAGASVPPSTSKTFPVTQDEASEAR